MCEREHIASDIMRQEQIAACNTRHRSRRASLLLLDRRRRGASSRSRASHLAEHAALDGAETVARVQRLLQLRVSTHEGRLVAVILGLGLHDAAARTAVALRRHNRRARVVRRSVREHLSSKTRSATQVTRKHVNKCAPIRQITDPCGLSRAHPPRQSPCFVACPRTCASCPSCRENVCLSLGRMDTSTWSACARSRDTLRSDAMQAARWNHGHSGKPSTWNSVNDSGARVVVGSLSPSSDAEAAAAASALESSSAAAAHCTRTGRSGAVLVARKSRKERSRLMAEWAGWLSGCVSERVSQSEHVSNHPRARSVGGSSEQSRSSSCDEAANFSYELFVDAAAANIAAERNCLLQHCCIVIAMQAARCFSTRVDDCVCWARSASSRRKAARAAAEQRVRRCVGDRCVRCHQQRSSATCSGDASKANQLRRSRKGGAASGKEKCGAERAGSAMCSRPLHFTVPAERHWSVVTQWQSFVHPSSAQRMSGQRQAAGAGRDDWLGKGGCERREGSPTVCLQTFPLVSSSVALTPLLATLASECACGWWHGISLVCHLQASGSLLQSLDRAAWSARRGRTLASGCHSPMHAL